MRSYWARVTRRLAALRQLRSPTDGLLVLQIFLFAVVVPGLLRVKLARLQSLLEPHHARPRPEPDKVRRIARCVDSVLHAGTPLVRPGCLTRGLTLYYFFRRAGLDVSLRFGMGKVGDEFVGHCWLDKDGEPFLEVKDPRPVFTEMYSIPQGAGRSTFQSMVQ